MEPADDDTEKIGFWRQVGIAEIRARTAGSPKVVIALIDGPVDHRHPCFAEVIIPEFDERPEKKQPENTTEVALTAHATALASMLVGHGNSVLGICPNCTLIILPVVDDAFHRGTLSRPAVAERLVRAIARAVAAGASVLQLSLEFSTEPGILAQRVRDALTSAAACGVRTVIAAGNRSTLGDNPVLSAPGVVPVALADVGGMPHPLSALGVAIGTRGLLAPGVDIPVAVPPNAYARRLGSSFSAGFVTGTFALLRSLLPDADPSTVWETLLRPAGAGTKSIVPPFLNGALALGRLTGAPSPDNDILILKR